MTRFRRLALALSTAALFALPLAAEDLTIVSKVSMGDRSTTSTQYVSSTKTRTSDGQNDTILDYATGAMTFIDHKDKSYSQTTQQEMADYMARLEKDLKGNPMLESMFGGSDAVSVKKGKGSRKIAGYDCDEYTMSMGSTFAVEFCAAKALKLPKEYYEGRKLNYAAMGPMGKRFLTMFEEMKKVEGFPLSLAMDVDMGVMKQETLSEAIEVKKGAIPASTFDLPAGYKKKKSPFQR